MSRVLFIVCILTQSQCAHASCTRGCRVVRVITECAINCLWCGGKKAVQSGEDEIVVYILCMEKWKVNNYYIFMHVKRTDTQHTFPLPSTSLTPSALSRWTRRLCTSHRDNHRRSLRTARLCLCPSVGGRQSHHEIFFFFFFVFFFFFFFFFSFFSP